MPLPLPTTSDPFGLLRWFVRAAGVAVGALSLVTLLLAARLRGETGAGLSAASAGSTAGTGTDNFGHAVGTALLGWDGLGLFVLLLAIGALLWWGERLLRAQQSRLQEAGALAAVGELAAAVAHNIRQPLASIRRSAEWALGAAPQPAQSWAIDILQDADRIAERIHQLMRLTVATPAENPTVDLVRLLNECVRGQERLFTRRHLLLRAQLPDQPMLVRADALLLRQVLDGLMNNAAEALGPEGRCRLRLKPLRDGWMRIEVQDNGTGLAQDTLRSVFAAPTAPTQQGLSLLLARRATELLGGRFTLKSQVDVGTTVRIELPPA